MHSDERPYSCAFCSSAFKSSSNRSKHERGSHTEQYQRRKFLREGHRNGSIKEEDMPPPAKKIKIAMVHSLNAKVIKQDPAPSPKKAINEFPCRYCDRVLKRADNRDKHEATHKDNRAFGKKFFTPTALQEVYLYLSFRLWILFKEFQDTRSSESSHKDSHRTHQTLVLSSWLRRSLPRSTFSKGA